MNGKVTVSVIEISGNGLTQEKLSDATFCRDTIKLSIELAAMNWKRSDRELIGNNTIMANNIKRGFDAHASEYEAKALEVLRSGWYVLGKEVEAFERGFAAYVGKKYCVGLASGLDALSLSCRALGIHEGDEVIVQANTYIASVMGITMNNAYPVFVEPDQYYGIDAKKIEAKITEKTKAIMVVHLYGIPCDMDPICALCDKYGLKLIEDCAQSHGATYKGRQTGSFGDIGCFSFYPSKNLGAFGDAGAIVTDDLSLYNQIKVLRNYGSEKRYHNKVLGVNSRLDELQAGLLSVKLKYLDEITAEKIQLARRYSVEINNPHISLPMVREDSLCVWHQYVIRLDDRETRDRLMAYLDGMGINSLIHYPIPPHLSEAYRGLGYHKGDFPIAERYADTVLSIPLYNGMTDEEQTRVIEAINAFE